MTGATGKKHRETSRAAWCRRPRWGGVFVLLLGALMGAAVVPIPTGAQGPSATQAPPGHDDRTPGPDANLDRVLDEVGALAPELLSRYIAIDTRNPPGNETAGARFLSEVLEREGIESQVIESQPGRGNLYARLEGTGAKRPVILLSHIDVVPAEAERWRHDPFAGAIDEGQVWGRGALDCKGIGITELLSVIAIHRAGLRLDRDVILLATADEEMGGRLGAGWMVEHHMDLLGDAEFVLNEGGFIRTAPDGRLLFDLSVAEKGPCWFRVVAEGTPGHASRPAAETAVTRLVAALDHLVRWERPLAVGPVVAGYFAAYATLDEQHARQFRQLERSLEDPEFRSWFLSKPANAALVRDTVTPTVLSGSAKTNIVPAEAMAEVDSRLLPGHRCADFLDEVRKRIGSEHVRVEPMSVAFPSSQSGLDNALTKAVEALASKEPSGAVVLPGLLSGFTDSHYFREHGMAAYGFVPIRVSPEQRETMHGPNERIDAGELAKGVRRLVELLRLVSR
ncbi:MAG: M20/M25/M40 family metallo-hydrolase [Deltaproteobacteria bacterium]|nr:MAG: M20/M25/M40 family metallo-hydrolase [Deltaproteobacteria bacterium]